ncbi:hypothetical protein QR680_014020 [Steinernema hermaphroditum]|uniref:Nematode cuticle collagen N-terminal domain-containing protein n=1 Tax=Steinernema hermaphroditum TaxID=289476 RepID=A0AA39I7F8_9BILA|nr:hypothetical protein QR680_014020 [Steinernema hermaphroditum]
MQLITRIVFSFSVLFTLSAAGTFDHMTSDEQWQSLHEHFRRPPKYDKPMLHNLLMMGSFFFTSICSVAALVIAWLSFNEVYFRTSRRLQRLDAKIKLCGDFTARRKFPDDVVERLSHVADFDMEEHREEIRSMLVSLGPAPGSGKYSS